LPRAFGVAAIDARADALDPRLWPGLAVFRHHGGGVDASHARAEHGDAFEGGGFVRRVVRQ
jgi:hypothetical protein